MIRLRSDIGSQELCEKLGVANGTVSRWETGKREPDLDTVIKLATSLNTSVAYLMGETDDPRPVNTVREITNERVGKRHTEEEIIALNAEAKKDNPASNVRFSSFYRIPVLSIAQAASCGAGNGLYGVEEEFTDFLFLDSNIFTRWDDMRKPFGIHIDGDSMEGAGLTEGSIAVINPAEETISGDAALVVWNDNWFIKWVVYMPNGDVELRSANPAYSPIKVEREYAENPDWFKIVGKVVDIVYKRRPKRAF